MEFEIIKFVTDFIMGNGVCLKTYDFTFSYIDIDLSIQNRVKKYLFNANGDNDIQIYIQNKSKLNEISKYLENNTIFIECLNEFMLTNFHTTLHKIILIIVKEELDNFSPYKFSELYCRVIINLLVVLHMYQPAYLKNLGFMIAVVDIQVIFRINLSIPFINELIMILKNDLINSNLCDNNITSPKSKSFLTLKSSLSSKLSNFRINRRISQ